MYEKSAPKRRLSEARRRSREHDQQRRQESESEPDPKAEAELESEPEAEPANGELKTGVLMSEISIEATSAEKG